MARKKMATREDLEYMLISELAEPKPLPYSVLNEITNEFSVEIGRGRSAVVYKGSIGNHKVAVKKLFVAPTQSELFKTEIKILMKVKHKNVLRILGYSSESMAFHNHKKGEIIQSKTQDSMICFEYLPATLSTYIEDQSHGPIWSQCYQIICGVCEGLHQLHEADIIHGDLKHQNILINDDMCPKIADFGLAKCLDKSQSKDSNEDTHRSNGTRGYMAPELLLGNAISKKSDLYSLGVIIRDILQGSLEAIDNVPHSCTKRFGGLLTDAELDQIEKCTQIGIECRDEKDTKRPDTKQILGRLGVETCSTQETQDSISKLLHVQPTVLVFVVDSQAGKWIPCPLQLENRTDKPIAFKLSTTESVDTLDWSEHFMTRLPLDGVIPARSTYTIILTVCEWKVPTKRICEMILESCISPYNHITKFRDDKEWVENFESHKATNAVDKVKLAAFLSSKHRPQQSEPCVKIVSLEKQKNILYSLDAHPTNPWIITGHDFGHVRIWNHETKTLFNSFKVSRGPVYSVKFIAQKNWFICGSEEGLIHVYSCEGEMQNIISFKAHDGLMSLAVHPTEPYVLSWPFARHHQKKLWDWEKEWECKQTFEMENFARDFLCRVAFDTKETNRFASTCEHAVKVWNICSVNSVRTLPPNFKQVNFLEFFTRDERQYLITVYHDMTATIWDMQTDEYVYKKRQTSVLTEPSVFSHPNLPILLTGSSDGTCHFWSSKGFRLEAVLDYVHGGAVRGISCLMGSKRSKSRCVYVIGQEATITIVDIANGKYQKDSVESSKPRSDTHTRQKKKDSQVIGQETNRLLHIHPTKLQFPFQAYKVNLCSLHLKNNNDVNVAFRLSVDEWWNHPFARMPISGIVPLGSTYTLVITTRELPYLSKHKFNLILQSSISRDRYKYTFKDQPECDMFFVDAKETGNMVCELTLEAVMSLEGLAMSKDGSTVVDLTQPLVDIWGLFDPAKGGSGMLCSLDADPTESRILIGHCHGNISLWNCGAQSMISSINIYEEKRVPRNSLNTLIDVYSIKFVRRKRWFIAGTRDGFIHVYNYEKRMARIQKVKAHSSGTTENGIYSSRALTIHPTKSYVLSTFEKMKLLDLEDNCKCIRTFESKNCDSVRQVVFNPKDTNTFASASSDHTIKFWNLGSSTAEYTLSGHSDKVNCLDFFTCAGQQYLISGSQDCTIMIWNFKKRTCVRTEDVCMSPVISITSLPDASYLTTGSEDGTIHLWSCASFSDSSRLMLKRVFNSGCGGPVQSLCLMGTKRVVIQQEGEISLMDIDTISETSVSALPYELVKAEPPALRFPDVQQVEIPLKISNITSHHVAFTTWSTRNRAYYYSSPHIGIISPKSTIQVFIQRNAHMLVPANHMHNDEYCLRTIIVVEGSKSEDLTLDMFEPMIGRIVHQVKLDVVLAASQIVSKLSLPWTLDVHPTKPWIMTTQGDYHIHVWNYDTRKTHSFATKGTQVTSAKFIACKQWIVVGHSSGIISLYNYNPEKTVEDGKKEKKKQVEKIQVLPQDLATTRPDPMRKIKIQRQHSERDKSLAGHTTRPDPMTIKQVKKIRVLRQHSVSVNSLAVHPTKPYVLSASQNGEILIWDYGNDWKSTTIVNAKSISKERVYPNDKGNGGKLMKKLQAKSLSLEQVAFPKETNMFAGAEDKTVKIWDLKILDLPIKDVGSSSTRSSSKPEHILSGHTDLVVCLDYFSLGGKLHLISGSQDKTAKIWDCETNKCVQTLEGHTDVVNIACCHPYLQILITGSRDGSIRLWDSNTFRNERTLKLDLGEMYAIACLKESTRIAIANEKGLAVVEIGLEDNKDDTVTIMSSKKEMDYVFQAVPLILGQSPHQRGRTNPRSSWWRRRVGKLPIPMRRRTTSTQPKSQVPTTSAPPPPPPRHLTATAAAVTARNVLDEMATSVDDESFLETMEVASSFAPTTFVPQNDEGEEFEVDGMEAMEA